MEPVGSWDERTRRGWAFSAAGFGDAGFPGAWKMDAGLDAGFPAGVWARSLRYPGWRGCDPWMETRWWWRWWWRVAALHEGIRLWYKGARVVVGVSRRPGRRRTGMGAAPYSPLPLSPSSFPRTREGRCIRTHLFRIKNHEKRWNSDTISL